MFDFPTGATRLHIFAAEYSEAIQNAALLLGGPQWLRRTQTLLDSLAYAPELTRHTKAEAATLYELLSLEHVHEFDRAESGYFADIDPAAPYIADICLLTEQLAEAIDVEVAA